MFEVFPKNKTLLTVALVSLMSTACSKIPLRNPFESYKEPELEKVANIEGTTTEKAKLVWTQKSPTKVSNLNKKLIPIAFGEYIYTVNENGDLTAVNLHTGKTRWKTKPAIRFTAGPEVVDGKLVMTASNMVLAYDLANGQEKWRRMVSSEVLSVPKGSTGIMVLQSIDGAVTALNSQNGEILWSVSHSSPSLSLRTKSAPAISGDKVVIGLSNGKVKVLNLYSGMIEWEHTLATSRGRSELQRMVDISADPVIKDGIAYVIAYQGNLAALDLRNQKVLWERKVSSHQNFALDANNIYVADDDSNLWAIDQKTGVTFWKQDQLSKRYITSPSIQNNYVVVGDRGGYIHWVDAQTGHIQKRFAAGKKLKIQPIVKNQYVLVKDDSGKLSMFDSAMIIGR